MALPTGTFPTRLVQLACGDVTMRGLSFAESRLVSGEDGVAFGLSKSLGEPLEDVKAWMDSIPAGDVNTLCEVLMELSGLSEGAQFRGGPGDVPGDERAPVED